MKKLKRSEIDNTLRGVKSSKFDPRNISNSIVKNLLSDSDIANRLDLDTRIALQKAIAHTLNEDYPEIAAIGELREDFGRHVARSRLLPAQERLQAKPKWQGTSKEGMKASEFLLKNYALEIEAGLRMSDIRDYDERLFYGLHNEARRHGLEFSTLGISQTNKVLNDRRALLSDVIGQSPAADEFATYFSSMSNKLDATSRGR